jgi:mono/diheme cytochrome c family protein
MIRVGVARKNQSQSGSPERRESFLHPARAIRDCHPRDNRASWGMDVFRAAVVALTLVCVPLATAAEDSRKTFEDFCASCHGVDGRARTPAGKKLGARDLSESKLSEAEIAGKILNGVRDQSGKEKMPPFKDRLPPDAIPGLTAFVKTFRR